MKYKILTKDTRRWGEGWQFGDIVGIDDEAARIPLMQGEIEEYTEEQAIEEVKKLEEVEEVKSIASQEAGVELKCEVCGKVCANKLGLMAHMRSHAGDK